MTGTIRKSAMAAIPVMATQVRVEAGTERR
jgi:hypothetical protein